MTLLFQDKVEEVKNDRYVPEEDKGKVRHKTTR